LNKPATWLAPTVALVALVSAAAAVAILEITQYPYPIWRGLVFRYLLFRQDLVGLGLLVAIAVLACIPATHAPALKLVEAIGRRPGLTAAAAFVALCLGTLYAGQNHALAGDEHLALMQSRIFAEGRLTGEVPPELLPWLVSDYYRYRWVMVDPAAGEIAAIYWPGFALLLAPFSALGIPWACNPLLAAGALALIAHLAEKLTGEAQAAGWAMLFTLASPSVSGQALSYFAMTAHLFVNLVFAWLLLERTPRRLFGAGLIGSLALLLHNPVPHLLFAAPWIVSLAWEPGARRRLLPLVLGYVPALVIGLAWAAFMRAMHGYILFAVFPHDDNPLHMLGNFLWYWHFRMGMIFTAPTEYSLAGRVGELVRLWGWTAPGLPLLAAAGWWLGRHDRELRLLGGSLAVTLAGYFLVSFDQGYGWGARYIHPAFGALPILGAVTVVAMDKHANLDKLRAWFASAAMLSLIFASALRWWQIHDYITEHVSRRPAYAEGQRQFVFVHHEMRYYTQDLVQNDPFLREPVVFLLSRGRIEDYFMMRALYPGARQVSDDWRGHVWRLD
jgi:hypothetical protein